MLAQIMGFPTALGMPRRGVPNGPAVLRQLGLFQALQSVVNAADLGDIPVETADPEDSRKRRLHKVMAAARRQVNHFPPITNETLPITIGGDHSTSLGTAIALARQGFSFDVVWIDAHGDFNTPYTSPSGNPHGMVLAILTGMTRLLPMVVPSWRLHLWGVRELDAGERELLEGHRVEVKDVAAVRAEGPALLRDLGENVFVSFDCDSCQPSVAPGTMTPVAGGFERDEALALMKAIALQRRLLALDVVELHPDQDVGNRTAELARDVIVTACAAQARQRAAERSGAQALA